MFDHAIKTSKKFIHYGGIILLAVGAWIVAILDNGTPDEFSQKAWPNTKELAEQAAINHFKTKVMQILLLKV